MKKILAALSAAVVACSMLATMASAGLGDSKIVEWEIPEDAVKVTIYTKIDFVAGAKCFQINDNVVFVDGVATTPTCYVKDNDGKEFALGNWGEITYAPNADLGTGEYGKVFDNDGYVNAYEIYLPMDVLSDAGMTVLNFRTWTWDGTVKDLTGNDGANIGYRFQIDLAQIAAGNTEVYIGTDMATIVAEEGDKKVWDSWWWSYDATADITYSADAIDTTPAPAPTPTGAAPVVAMAVVSMLAAAVVISKRK